MERTNEYINKCREIFDKGGKLWLIERTDTHEFWHPDMRMKDTHDEYMPFWSSSVGFATVVMSSYLTKEDAEDSIGWLQGINYGCPKCGYGKTPVTITEHEFVPRPE